MKTIIIIPYRNRQNHLKFFLENSWPKLKSLNPNIEILIVEQEEGKKFNRGKTLNIGFDYYNNQNNYYITQDVDVNPILDEIFDLYNKEVNDNEILAIYSDENTLGGICKIKGSTLKTINGFPNDFWGWGCEDKDLLNRALFYNIKIERVLGFYLKDRDKYLNIHLDEHIREPNEKHRFCYNIWNYLEDKHQKNYIENNGLSCLNYEIIKEEILMDSVKKITVKI